MACVKGVARSASVAFAPDAPYLAAGTMAGAVDLSFSSSSNLEIFRLDFQSDDRELPVVGECPSSERFNRLSWGKNGSGSEEFALGLIAGGFVDGTIDIWNPHSLLSSEEGSSASALVGHLSKHRGIVRGLEFNTISPNLLASGAEEGEICIWDLASPASPSHFPPLKGSGSASQGELSFLSWNSKVQHILAATSYNGTTVVWDLKKQKPVISFSDSVRRRCSVLQWNPDVATQLVVSSDEDSSPSIKLWDMRNIMTPVKEFIGHTKGVIAMSWCPSDSSYLITCGKDNRTICWDTISGEIVCELPAGTNWNFDVHWFSQMPGVISASSFDGKIGLYNIEGCSRYGLGENDFGTVNLRAPKWYKRPVGTSFGFGGKLISFQSKPTSTGATTCYTEVYIHNLVAEHSLVRRSSEFEEAIQNGEKLSLRTLCEKKYSESISEDERETWGFLKIMFEEEGTARTKLLSHLGFSVPTKEDEVVVERDFEDRDLGQSLSGINVGGKEENAGSKESTLFQLDNGEDFFNNLPSPKADTPVSTSCGILADRGSVSIDEQLQELNGHDESSDLSFDTTIQRALVVGDYKGAVAECISANKYADALVIAHVGGTVLWENTRDQYLKSSHSAYLKVVNALVNNDLLRLAKMRPLNSWKETLALLCTFARAEEWALLCDTLASRLVDVGNTLAATLCYICAGNIDKTVEIWSQSLTYEHGKKPFVELLQDLMERTMVLALATGQKRFSTLLYTLVEKYTEILAGQGLLTTAMEYIKLLGSDELSPELVILRDRIAFSTEADTKTTSAGSTKPQTEFQYSGGGHPNPALVEPLRSHYPEQSLQQMQQNYSINQYTDNAQPNFSSAYSRGPHGPGQFPTPPQAHSFIPSPVAHEQPGQTPSFGAAPANTNTVTSFIPTTPLPLKNAGQFQQSTLISQLYPGTIPSYQPSHVHVAPNVSTSATVPRQLMSQVSSPVPSSRGVVPGGVVRGAGFEQGINPGVVKQPVLGPMQPPSPPHPITATQSAVTPPAPPPSIQTADTSNVSAHHKPVITTLKRLFNESVEAAGGQRATQMKKREIEDNSRKIGALFERLNCGDISSNASEKLIHLSLALDHADFASALQIQVQLTTSEWDECNFWLATLKRMIKTVQGVRMS